MDYNLSDKKYKISALGTKPKLIKKTLDKTDIKPVLEDLFEFIRDILKLMGKYDRSTTGASLYKSLLQAEKHFALSYYHVGITNKKYEEAYDLVCELETIKFLLEQIFRLNMIHDSKEHVDCFRNRAYTIIANLQEQIDKWYNWIVAALEQSKNANK